MCSDIFDDVSVGCVTKSVVVEDKLDERSGLVSEYICGSANEPTLLLRAEALASEVEFCGAVRDTQQEDCHSAATVSPR